MNDLFENRWNILNSGLLWIIISHIQVHHVLGIITFAVGSMFIAYAVFLFLIEGGERRNPSSDGEEAKIQHPCPACRNKIGTIGKGG